MSGDPALSDSSLPASSAIALLEVQNLACERGTMELSASGERFLLAAGDVVVFRGDQKHGYANVGAGTAVGYSVVVLRPVPA